MKMYSCFYQYKRGINIVSETNSILADNPEQVRNLLCKVLGVNHLEYFTYSQVGDDIVAISSEIVESICRQELERTKKRTELKVCRDTIRHPTPEQRQTYEDKKDVFSPRPFISKVKETIMKDYQ